MEVRTAKRSCFQRQVMAILYICNKSYWTSLHICPHPHAHAPNIWSWIRSEIPKMQTVHFYSIFYSTCTPCEASIPQYATAVRKVADETRLTLKWSQKLISSFSFENQRKTQYHKFIYLIFLMDSLFWAEYGTLNLNKNEKKLLF